MKPITADFGKFKEELFLVQNDVRDAYYERAINKLHELIVHHPDRAEPHYELGKIAYNFWNNQEAEKNHLNALRIDPEYFPTYTHYALILIKEARFDEAEIILERAKTVKNREDADIYFYFGMLFQHKGELDAAIDSYTRAINLSINESQIDLNLKFIRACKELRGWE